MQMMYKNREDAAEQLLTYLQKYKKDPASIVLALPRGGVVIGDIIAKKLNIPLDIIISKKIPSLSSDELAIGAVCEDIIYLNEKILKELNIADDLLQNQISLTKKRILEKKKLYNKENSNLNLKDKTIILVDDGIATGASIIAAIEAIKARKAKKIILCSPVAPFEVIEEIKPLVNELICPIISNAFYAVGQFYLDFTEISDEQVKTILK
ncbi:MAG: phosphoribosyltransferase family protein [Parachlamydiales bacterium]